MEKESKKKYYLLILLISILVSAPLFAKGFFTTHDGNFHVNRVIGTIQAIKDSQILPMIIPNFVNGFGYGTNLFYPPIACYLPIMLMFFTFGNILNAFKLMVFIAILMSGINMFNLIFDITKSKKASLIVTLLYLTVPYKIIDIYVRMAIGEILAFAFIPLLFQGLYDIVNNDGKKWYLLVIGAVGILLSHTISTFLVAFISLIYILCYIDKIFKEKKIKKIFIAFVFIIGMVSFFFIPFIETTLDSQYYVEYYNSKLNLKAHSSYLYELLMGKMNNNYLLTLSNPNKANEELCLTLGLHIIIPLLFTPFIWKKVNKKLYIITLAIGLISALATTNIFPWEILQNTIFGFIQFPMRMFIISTFTLSIISGVNIYLLLENKESMKDILILTLIIYIYIQPIINLVEFDAEYDTNSGYEIEDISQYKNTISTKCSEFEYLPIKALINFSYLQNRSDEIILLSGNAEILEQNKNGTSMTAIILNTSEDATIELPYIYYKGYTCTLNNEKMEVTESENGMISINLPKGSEGNLTIKYKGTLLAYVSLVISILTILVFAIYLIYNKSKRTNKSK